MAFSTYAGNLLFNFLRGAAPTAPTGLYMSLHTADPGITGASEVSGSGYVRQQLTMGAASNKGYANTNTLSQTFTGSVGPVTYVGVWDASTAGNFLHGAAVTTSKTYGSGDTETVAAGAITYAVT